MERKRIFMVGIVAILLLPSMMVLSESASANSFTLHSWEVADWNGHPSLFIAFDIDQLAEIKMFDPTGKQVEGFPVCVNETMHSAYIPLTWMAQVSPPGGTYRMEVEIIPPPPEPFKTIFMKNFTFEGAELTILDYMVNWTYSSWGGYYPHDLNITVKNNGGLPIYSNLNEVETKIDGKTYSMTIFDEKPTMPNEQKFLTANIDPNSIPFSANDTIPPGDYTMTITLKYLGGETISTHTKQISLEKKGGNTPGFELAFAIVALLAVAYYLRKRR